MPSQLGHYIPIPGGVISSSQQGENWLNVEAAEIKFQGNRIISGMAVTAGAGLAVNIALGEAFIRRHISLPAQSYTMPANATKYLWLTGTTTTTVAGGLITDTGGNYVVTDTAVNPGSALLARVTTGASLITTIEPTYRHWANRWESADVWLAGDPVTPAFLIDQTLRRVAIGKLSPAYALDISVTDDSGNVQLDGILLAERAAAPDTADGWWLYHRAGDVYVKTPAGVEFKLVDETMGVGGGGGGGEANTASNQGVGGVGLFKAKFGVDLQFKNLNAASASITITDDVANSEVDIDVVDASTTVKGLVELATDGEVAALLAVQANDARLSNQRVPTDGSVTTVKIVDDAVTFAKFQDIATAKLLGRATAATGNVEEITLGTNLSFTGTTLNAATGGYTHPDHTGEVTSVGDGAQTITALAVTAAKLAADAVETAKILNLAVTTGKINDLAVTTGKLNDLAVTAAKIADDTVTFAKLQNIATARLLGRATAASGDIEELTLGTNLSFTGTTLNSVPGSHTHTLADITDEGALAALNTVGTAQIDNLAVTNGKLAALAVDAAKLAANAVETAKILDAAVTFAKMQNIATARLLGRTTAAAGIIEELTVGSNMTLAAGVLNASQSHTGDVSSGSDGVTTIGALKVLTGMLNDLAVTAGKIAADAVTTAKILDANVTAAKLATDSVETAKIVADAVTNPKLANMALGTIKGRSLVSAGDPEDLTASSARTVLAVSASVDLPFYGYVAKTSPTYTIASGDHLTMFSNAGTTQRVDFTLPEGATVGMMVGIHVADADGVRVIAGASDFINIGAHKTQAAGYMECKYVGEVVWFIAHTVASPVVTWKCMHFSRPWTVQTTAGVLLRVSPGIDTQSEDSSAAEAYLNTTHPRGQTSVSSALAPLLTQTLHLNLIYLEEGMTVTNIFFWSGNTAAGTPTNWWFALYNYDLTLIAQTADQTTTAWGTSEKKLLALTSAQSLTRTGRYYLGLMVKATTVPTFRGNEIFNGIAAEAPIRSGRSTGSLTATAPATAAAITAGSEAVLCYAGVS